MFQPSDDQLCMVLSKKGYGLPEDDETCFIGIRLDRIASNKFDDTFIVIGKHGTPLFHVSCTTDPGSPVLAKPREGGTAILKPGKYKYQLGMHQGKYPAFVQAEPVTVYRDANRDNILDYVSEETGWFGINIHKAGPNSVQVDNWSEGCQVISAHANWEKVLQAGTVECHRKKWISYILLERSDFEEAA